MKRQVGQADGRYNFGAVEYALIFLAARLVLIISLPLDGLRSYGDFWNFYYQAGLGIPFIDFWTEFPPIFPFISRFAYQLAGGREHSYILLVAGIFSIVQAFNVYFFAKISNLVIGKADAAREILLYSFLTLSLFYTWAYFDVLAVFCMFWGMLLVLERKEFKAGLLIAAGGLIKWFPLLLLPAAWQWLGTKKAARMILSVLIVIIIVWGVLFLASPEYTKASLISQGAKGSWETVWALMDGNLSTGNFGSGIDRLDPASAAQATGNPPVIPAWASLLIFGSIGLFALLSLKTQSPRDLAAMLGLTVLIFFLWSPGYSPQWILFILPIPLWVLDRKRGWLITFILVLISLLEWPILLSRGWFHFLEEIVIIRTALFLLIGIMFYQFLSSQKDQVSEVDLAE